MGKVRLTKIVEEQVKRELPGQAEFHGKMFLKLFTNMARELDGVLEKFGFTIPPIEDMLGTLFTNVEGASFELVAENQEKETYRVVIYPNGKVEIYKVERR